MRVNGQLVDAASLIEGDPVDVPLDDVDAAVLMGREVPILTIVQWTTEMKRPLGLVLCNQGGASLREVPGTRIPLPVKATGYLKWSGFAEFDLALPELEFTPIIELAKARLDEFVKARTEELTGAIVATLKAEGSYPYSDETLGPIEEAEREVFDLVVVTARHVIGANKAQRAMSAKLLHLALQERPEELDEILAAALRLGKDERDQLADMLRYSSLASIVGAAAQVGRRLELLLTLTHLLYDPDESKLLREVDQLHPLVRDNVWLFGEEWRLTGSEAGLVTILRAVLKDQDVALESDLVQTNGRAELPKEIRGRVDLLLQRTLDESANRQRLVVELKRPSIALGEKELAQIKRYARMLAEHPGCGPSKWTFWLVGTRTAPEIAADLTPTDRPWGHVISQPNYDVRVATWSGLISQAERRLNFYQQQLRYDITQDDAVDRVRARHAQLIHPAPQ